jgi:AAA domain
MGALTMAESGLLFNHDDVARLAVALLGPPNKKLSTKDELRFGSHGSLSVDLDKAVFHDFETEAGGGFLELIERAKGLKGREAIDWLRANGVDVPDAPKPNGHHPKPSPAPKQRIEKVYDYTDETGALVFQVVRMGPQKTFRQRRPFRGNFCWMIGEGFVAQDQRSGDWFKANEGDAGAVWVPAVTQVPYRLPDVLAAIRDRSIIMVAEGEKDVDNLAALGIPATCNAAGAGKWPPELDRWFKGARVVILPDNDEPGRKHRDLVGNRLLGIAQSVKTLDLPGLPPKGDVSDWLAAGGSFAGLYDLLDAATDIVEDERALIDAPPPDAPPRESRLGRVSVGEISRRSVEAPDYVIDGWMMAREQSFLAGESQSGKSFLALHAGMSIALGREVLGRKTKPGLVIYQAGESGTGVLNLRIPAWIKHFGEGVDFSEVPFEIIPARVNLFRPDGNAEEFHQVVASIQKEWAGRAELRAVIIDTMSKVMSGANENDGRDVSRVLDNGERISRETGAHVCFVHHLPKNGSGMRGHGSLKGDTDSVVMIAAAPTGVRTITFDKVKDGEAGGKLTFELMQVKLGEREDGERITSCVVLPVGEKMAARRAEEMKGFALRPKEEPIFRAILAAVKRFGRVPDEDMLAKGVPEGVAAVHFTEWRDLYRHEATPDEDGEPVTNDVIRKHWDRNARTLISFNVVGWKSPYMWLKGKAVRGFPETHSTDYSRYGNFGQNPDTAGTEPGQNPDNAPADPEDEIPFL